jgi:hypothetical protein
MLVVLVILIFLLIISLLKWWRYKVSTLALICYMEKKQYKSPTKKEFSECTEFVAKHIADDLTSKK